MKTNVSNLFFLFLTVVWFQACSDGTDNKTTGKRGVISSFSEGNVVTISGKEIQNIQSGSLLNMSDTVDLSLDVSIDGINQKTGLHLAATNNHLLNFTVRIHGCHSLNEQSVDVSPSVASTYGTQFGEVNKTIKLIKGDTGCKTQLDQFIFKNSSSTAGSTYIADTREKDDWAEKSNVRFTHTAIDGSKKHVFLNVTKQLPETITGESRVNFAITTVAIGDQVTTNSDYFSSQLVVTENTEINLEVTEKALHLNPAGHAVFDFRLRCTAGMVQEDLRCGDDKLDLFKANLVLDDAGDLISRMSDDVSQCLAYTKNSGTPKTIRSPRINADRGKYTPTTGITLGSVKTMWQGNSPVEIKGHVIAKQFQFNLEYDPSLGIDDTYMVDRWNNWQAWFSGGDDLPNWRDPEYYVLKVNLNGGLTVHTYNNSQAPTTENLQWTITGWNHTIIGGKIEETGGKTRLVVVGDYRNFPASLQVNAQESFSGSSHKTELIAYTYDGPKSDLAAADLSGKVLGVELRRDSGCSLSDTSVNCESQRPGQDLSVFKVNEVGYIDEIDHTDGGATVQISGPKRSLNNQAADDYTALNYVLVLGSEDTKKCKAWPLQIEKPEVKKTIRTVSSDTKGYYTPTTGLNLGAVKTMWKGNSPVEIKGHVIVNQFQLNLEYDPSLGVDDTYMVDRWNNWQSWYSGGEDLPNWRDPEYYVLKIKLDGGLTVHTYNSEQAPTTENLQWTITGWNQTILGGKIEETGGKTRLVVVGDYRNFSAELKVNAQEAFAGSSHKTELIAYTYDGPKSDLGAADLSGIKLGVELRKD